MESGRRNVSEDEPETIVQRSARLDADEESWSDKIPMDLIIEIFSRLPLNSIARFRCVSKQWATTLRRTDFTDLFLTRSLARPKLSIAFPKGSEFLFFSSSPQPPPRENVSVITIDHHVSFPVERDSVEHISTPLNGLFCIRQTRMILKEGSKTRESVWVICNPSTRQSFTLPKLMKTRKDGRRFLGYDPISKQHKVLAMTKEDDGSVEHQVLTLGTGGGGNLTWRMVECSVAHSFPQGGYLCINGVLYYAAKVSNLVDVIICFDVRSEKYSFVKAAAAQSGLLNAKLINFLGKLALVTHPWDSFPPEASTSLEMWILEDAEKHEWSKRIFNLPPICEDKDAVVWNYLKFVGVTAANEFVFAHYSPSDPFHVYYYNFVEEVISRVDIQGFGAFENVFTTHVCLNHVEDVKLIELF